MTRQNASTFPNHKYDFGDSVYVKPLNRSGIVEGIWLKGCIQTWHYTVSKIPASLSTWWQEDQLEPACPNCLAPWDEQTPCNACGRSPDELF